MSDLLRDLQQETPLHAFLSVAEQSWYRAPEFDAEREIRWLRARREAISRKNLAARFAEHCSRTVVIERGE